MERKQGDYMKTLSKKKSIISWALIALICIVVFIAPSYMSKYEMNILITILSTAYLAQCWNLMSGFTGQFSFGHAAFYGLGAYTSSLLYVDFGISPWIGIIMGMLVAGVVAAIIGFLSFYYNLKGDYFALATLAFAEILRAIFKNTKGLKAAAGVSITYNKDVSLMQFAGKSGYLYMIFIMLFIITVGIYFLKKTKTGLYFVAIRENEDAAKALGINGFKYKMMGLIASAMLTALAGTFYAQYYLYIDPTIVFGSTVSTNAITPCIIGGVGTVFGPILGAFIIQPISILTNAYLSKFIGLNMIVYGLILCLVIIIMPNGVLGLGKKVKVKIFAKKNGGAVS